MRSRSSWPARGARVVLASRDWNRTELACNRIQTTLPGARVETMQLDLADLASVRDFARRFNERHDNLDILVNNAGISGGPRRQTQDGFEKIFQVNYLGHFALTGLLLPVLCARPGARVVTMSSDIAARGRIDFCDLQARNGYGLVSTYAQSKLANLIFSIELERRARQAGAPFSSFATNPGIARTELFSARKQEWGRSLTFAEGLLRLVQTLLVRSADQGAIPALHQATDQQAQSAEYVGGAEWPRRFRPVVEPIPSLARDQRSQLGFGTFPRHCPESTTLAYPELGSTVRRMRPPGNLRTPCPSGRLTSTDFTPFARTALWN